MPLAPEVPQQRKGPANRQGLFYCEAIIAERWGFADAPPPAYDGETADGLFVGWGATPAFRQPDDVQSTFAPDAFTTFSYLASSARMNAPNSSGVFATGSAISAAKRVLASGV